jgi:peptidoglycan/LPS O-acetylase OafA/YrhL
MSPLALSGVYGWTGVHVFFVISGFVIPLSLHNSNYRVSNFGRFFLKRLVRLEPPYLASIVITLLLPVIVFLSPRHPLPVPVSSLLVHPFYLNGILKLPWLLPVYWTLAVEIEFYIVVGLFFPLIKRPLIFWTVAAPVAVALAFALPFSGQLSFYLPIFLLGIAAFHLSIGAIGKLPFLGFVLALGVIALRLLLPVAALVAVTAALLIAFIQRAPRPLVALGAISYPLYLLHLPLGYTVFSVWRRVHVVSPWIAIAIAVSVSLIGAWLLHVYVEIPAMRWASRIRYGKWISTAALVLPISLGCTKPAATPLPQRDDVAPLVHSVATSRVRVDSVIREIHRLSGDSTASTVAKSLELRKKASALDVRYRESLVQLLSSLNGTFANVPVTAARFPDETRSTPFVRAFADGANWMLQSPLIYQIGNNPWAIVIVPRGFVTDFASMPQPLRALRDLLPSTERYGIPALVHDYLYWRQDCTREQADDIMEIALKNADVSVLERSLVHQGLRSLGQSAWEQNRNARQSGLIRTVGAPYDAIPLAGTWPQYRDWLRSVHAPAGEEFRVPRSVCEIAALQ